jgi:hypothetical protein
MAIERDQPSAQWIEILILLPDGLKLVRFFSQEYIPAHGAVRITDECYSYPARNPRVIFVDLSRTQG